MELVEDSEGALVFTYRPWALFQTKRILPLGVPAAMFVFTLGAFGLVPFPWVVMFVSWWLGMAAFLITGDMHRDWFWRFDRKLGEAIYYTRRAPHLRNIHIPILWAKPGEIRRIKFDTITDVLLEDRRIYGFPEYRITLILDGPPDDDRNRVPLIYPFHPDKKLIDWSEKLKATVYGGSSQV